MVTQKFYLVGEDVTSTLDIDISDVNDLESLKTLVAGQFAIVKPDGMHKEKMMSPSDR